MASLNSDPRLMRAYGYPYPAPEHDFLFRAGDVAPLDLSFDLGSRQPVIAVGSNRAPEQLARKFGPEHDRTIPVTWAWMQGYDVVYCAHLAGYGSVPATLHGSPGTEVRVAITWLTEEEAWVLSLLGEENGPRRAHLTERLSETTMLFEDPRFRVVLG